MAGGLPDRAERGDRGDQPRPHLPRSGVHPDRGNRAGHLAHLPGQLQPAPGTEGPRARGLPVGLRAPAEGAQRPAGLHRPLPRQRHPLHPGQEPREAAGEGGADRGAGRNRGRASLPLPRTAPLRPGGGRGEGPHPQLRRADPVPRRRAGGGAGRSDCLRGPQRRRQIHPAAADHGHGAAR